MNVSLYWLLCDPTLLLRVLAVHATLSQFVTIFVFSKLNTVLKFRTGSLNTGRNWKNRKFRDIWRSQYSETTVLASVMKLFTRKQKKAAKTSPSDDYTHCGGGGEWLKQDDLIVCPYLLIQQQHWCRDWCHCFADDIAAAAAASRRTSWFTGGERISRNTGPPGQAELNSFSMNLLYGNRRKLCDNIRKWTLCEKNKKPSCR